MPETADFQIYNVVIGTAGHIDHGKSTVVKRLTGIDPDRLPEEKEREMTIDLGFANFPLKTGQRVGIIDVPGHEDFIKNMLAGATGIDIVMLVVSAQQGVQPQTVEHLRIMDLLGLKRGLIVINKVDAVEPDLVELAVEDVKDLVKGTFLEEAPILRVSALTGQGFDELYETINRIVLETPPRQVTGVFRMPIQRIFSKKGFGTVITGVPLSGRVTAGDTLEILPLGRKARVKSMQAYLHPVPEVRAGHSSALNVSDVDYQEIKRGDVAATPGYFKPSRFIEAKFKFIPDTVKYMPEGLRVLKSFMPIKFHSGTKEADGKVVILDRPTLSPGEEAFVQLRLDEPVVVAEGDSYILRIQTPTYTIGGGKIVDISGTRLKRFKDQILYRLEEKSETIEDRRSFILFTLKDQGFRFVTPQDVIVAAKAPPELVTQVIEELKSSGRLVFNARGKFMHVDTLRNAAEVVRGRVAEYHRKNPLRAGIKRLELKQSVKMDDELFELVMKDLLGSGQLIDDNDRIHLPDFKVRLSKEDSEIGGAIEKLLREARWATPSLTELYEKLQKYPQPRVRSVVDMLCDAGNIAMLKDEILMHRDALNEAKELLVDYIKKHGSIEPGKFRDLLQTTRKYIIPMLEYFDDIGVTVRQENRRVLRQK